MRPKSLRDHERALGNRFNPHGHSNGAFRLKKRCQYGEHDLVSGHLATSPGRLICTAKTFAMATRFILHSSDREGSQQFLELSASRAVKLMSAYIKLAHASMEDYHRRCMSNAIPRQIMSECFKYCREVYEEWKADAANERRLAD